MSCDWCLSTLGSTTGSVITCILERLWNPIERQGSYLVRYRSNLKTFRERVRELEALKSDVLTSMKDADDKGEEIKAEVLNWLVETIQLEMDVECLEEKIEKIKGCCHVWHLDWRSRHRLSRLAKKKTIDIDGHLPRGKFDRISFPARPADLRSLPPDLKSRAAGLRKRWPEEEDLQKCQKLSLMDSNVKSLLDRPECPQLTALFLQNNVLEDIPTRFFERMRALNFLDLSDTNISSLPLSLECLEKLCSHRIENTHSRNADFNKEFEELEVLILKALGIYQKVSK